MATSRPRTPSGSLSKAPSLYGTPRGLGLDEGTAPTITTELDYDFHKGINDSPSRGPDTGRTDASLLSGTSSVAGGLSPSGSLNTPITPQTGGLEGGFPQTFDSAAQARNPFNFTTQQYVAGRGNSVAADKNDLLGKRRGHKYRHSSIHVSAMDSIVQPPVARTPLMLPSSLPIPTRRETWYSLTSNQTLRLVWCACHFLISAYVQYSGAGSLAMTALSRLLLFDAAGATVCVVVDVMGNFEVWKRSSIKHPFGLERADVLAGFGMAVFISFMGLDIISHGVEHSLENIGSHVPHTEHEHERVSAGSVDSASLLAIIATLVSAILLKNHKRIGKAIRFSTLARWGKIFGNPSHVLTLSCSALLLILPLLSIKTYSLFDLIFSLFIAISMIAFGVRLGTSLASMLLMSYKPPSDDKHAVRDVISEVASDGSISAVEEARFWQVHYGLCMANLKVRYFEGAGDDMSRVRRKVTELIRQRLGGKWEVSLQMAVERD